MKSAAIARSAFHLALFSGLAITVWGLTQQLWPEVLPWGGPDALRRYATTLFSIGALAALASMLSRKDPIFVGCMLAGVIAVLSGSGWAVLVAIGFVLASVMTGEGLFKLLRIRHPESDPISRFLAGAGLYGTFAGLLAHLPVNYIAVYATAISLPLIFGRRGMAKWLSEYRARSITNVASSSSEWWLGLLIATVGLIHFVVALMPELGFDALAVHLFVPAQMALRHQWGFDPELYVWAVMPMLGDWLFAIVYLLGGETSARMLNLGFLYLLAILARDIVYWAGGDGKAAKWAMLIFLSTPLAFTESNTLFIESIWTAYAVFGVFVFLRFAMTGNSEESSSQVALTGLILGFAAAAKFGTIAFLPILAALFLYSLRSKPFRRLLPSALAGLMLFILFGGIPYLTAWVITENPVFPFLNATFQSPFYPAVDFDNALFKAGLTWDVLYRVTFDSAKYLEASNGAAGFQWLLLLLPSTIILIASRNSNALLLLAIGAILVAVTFQTQSYLRYVFPSFLLMASAMGVSLSAAGANALLGKDGIIFSMSAILAIFLNLAFLASGTWAYRDIPVSTLTSDASRRDFLDGRLPLRQAVEFVNMVNKARTPVALFGPPFGAGLNTDALYPNWYNHRFNSEIDAAKDAQTLADVLHDHGAEFVLLDSGWGTAEKRVIVETATRQIAAFGSTTVRTLKQEYRFGIELLANPGFSGTDAWTLAPGAEYDEKRRALIVSVTSPATQAIKTKPGRRYLLTAVAECHGQAAQGRLQINWLDEKSQFITTSIQVFDCKDEMQTHTMEAIAPGNAVVGIVYAAAHTEQPIAIKSLSLR